MGPEMANEGANWLETDWSERMLRLVEYIWLDGDQPTQKLRSKSRVLPVPEDRDAMAEDFPLWSFDGSSTNQSDGTDSDLLLLPVNVVRDPIRDGRSYLVMCEVLNADGSPHESNQRSRLVEVLEDGGAALEPWIGFEQEYTLFRNGRPLGFPSTGFPEPQGPYYCGVGSGNVFGRELVEAHADACLRAGILLYGINAEVMPGQWEFQVGYRGVDGESADPLTVSDHLHLARFLLSRLGEDFDVRISFDAKPVKGDWNGAGAHTNFSTRAMRDAAGGLDAIREAVEKLSRAHDKHIANYGAGLADRLTGLHETCSIEEFRSGIADRGASIRIPRHVASQGRGYLEDRRPGANCDPYRVSRVLLETVCGPGRAVSPHGPARRGKLSSAHEQHVVHRDLKASNISLPISAGPYNDRRLRDLILDEIGDSPRFPPRLPKRDDVSPEDPTMIGG